MNRTFEKFGATTMRRFYAGAEHIGNAVARGLNESITRLTIDDAVVDARKTLAKEPHRGAVIIVEIVAVVYREDPPVRVDYLKDEEKNQCPIS